MGTTGQLEPAEHDAAGASDRCRARQQAALLAFGRRTAAPPELGVLLRDALTFLIDAFEVEYGWYAEPAAEPECLSVRVEVHGTTVRPEARIETFGSRSIASQAVEAGRLFVASNLTADVHYKDHSLRRLGVVSAVAAPLQHCEQRFGAVVLGAVSPKTATSDDLAFLEAVSHLLAFAIARDKIDQILRDERSINAEMYDALPQVVLLLDGQGRIQRINRACEELTGFRADELIGRFPWDALASPECAATLETEFLQTLATKKRLTHGSTLLTKSGERRAMQWSHSALHSSKVLFTGDVLAEKDKPQRSDGAAQAAAAAPTPGRPAGGAGQADAKQHEKNGSPDKQQPQPAKSGRDRRTSDRRTFPFQQRIAPYRGVTPREEDFFLARFSDISAGGASFILPEIPEYKAVVIELGTPPRITKIHSDIVRVVPIKEEGRPMFLLGCRFVERFM